MRFIRLLFVVLLALFLIGLALANRNMVTLSAFPANFGQYLGGQWTITLPLFLIVFGAFALGMLAGLVWEWLRESHIRREARAQADKNQRLENEVGALRVEHSAPRDEVLAILERPKPQPMRDPAPSSTVPAPR